MAGMAFSALLFYIDIMDVLPKEGVESLVGILLKTWPSFLDVSLQLCKKLLYGVKIWRVRWDVQ